MPRRIYVASSWRNERQPDVVKVLRLAEHQVYDFRNPGLGASGFHWSEIDPNWQGWDRHQFRDALQHPTAINGYASDWAAMQWADTCVLVMPCGRSAHIEAGYFVGAGKELHILLADGEPELMYKMATALHTDTASLLTALWGADDRCPYCPNCDGGLNSDGLCPVCDYHGVEIPT